MRFVVFSLLVISHISVFIICDDKDPLYQPNPTIFNDDSRMVNIIGQNLSGILAVHKHSGHDPIELLIKSEFMLLVGLGLRSEILVQSYMYLIEQAKLDSQIESLANKIEPKMEKLTNGIEKNVGEMIKELGKIHKKYDIEDFNLPSREPGSFMSLELIKYSFNFIQEFYEMVKDLIESSKIDEELKKKLISTLKTKTILSALSTKILLLKMFYDVGLTRKLRMRFIIPGIFYLLVFENGICERVSQEKLNDDIEFLNKFLENYNDSIEELIQKALFYIKEDELPKDVNETLHKDLVRMHKDFNEVFDKLISINKTPVKNSEV